MLAASRIDPEAAFVVPERFSVGKRNLMAALGAEIVNTPAGEGMGDAIDRAREMADSRANAVVPRQFLIPSNAGAHYETTGPKVHNALDGEVDAIVMDCRTAGTLTGTARDSSSGTRTLASSLSSPSGQCSRRRSARDPEESEYAVGLFRPRPSGGRL